MTTALSPWRPVSFGVLVPLTAEKSTVDMSIFCKVGQDATETSSEMVANLLASEGLPTQTSTQAPRRSVDPSERAGPWLTYRQAASYCSWSVPYLRNLVSAGQIPVYGKPRVRRFRRDMLDLFLTDPDAAMRRFRVERNPHGS
jgi:excisionase family DNA binding protein